MGHFQKSSKRQPLFIKAIGIEKRRLGLKCLIPRNKKEFTKIALQIFVNSGLFPKGLLLLPPFIQIPGVWDMTRRVMSQTCFFYSQYNKKYKMSEFSKISLTYLVDKAIIDKITYKTQQRSDFNK